MSNQPRVFAQEAISLEEQLSTKDIIHIFQESLKTQKDGYFPTFDEVQEALRVFLAHLRAVNSLHIGFIQSTLGEYGKATMEDVEKHTFIGLQGYIQYIEKRILKPLLMVIELEEDKTTTSTTSALLEKVQKEVIIANIAIHNIKQNQQRILQLLESGPSPREKNEAIKGYNECAKLLQETE